jgi:ABC-type sugar transport system ATPase subunit
MSHSVLADMQQISKRFGRVSVLRDVDFQVRAGEIHVLAGENGAGKSTLIRILGGIYTDFAGRMQVNGRHYAPRDPVDAGRQGVAVIHQELSLVPEMSVADNVFLGRPPTALGGFVADRRLRMRAAQVLARLGLRLDVTRPAGSYSIATQQLIEIAKALGQDARILVMDEPTSALNAPEVERLFQLVGQLRGQGCGIVYITHKMEEIEQLADRITVLRDGERIGTAPAAQLPQDKLIHWMVGRQMDQQFPRHAPAPGPARLAVQGFSVFPRGPSADATVREVTFQVRAGEILGVGGLQGSGASDLFRGIFGAYGRRTAGHLRLDDRPVRIHSPRQAIAAGLALLTSDRKATELFLGASVIRNTVMADLPRFSPAGWCLPARERAATQHRARSLQLRAASLDMPVGALSGGNQQKVALAKWLQTEPRILLLDEPTRGVDVGAKREIYDLMNQWTAQGIAILLITSEMPELLAMSDRILVLHRGRATAEFTADQATADKVLAAAMGST